MTFRSSISFASLMALGLASYAQPAAAREFTVPAGAQAASGMIFGDAFTAMKAPNGTCTWQILGVGGMTELAIVNGTAATEKMAVVTSSASFCGFTMTPLVTNGFSLTFNGKGGADLLIGGTKASVNGESGDDIVRSEKFGSTVRGGPGSDLIASTSNEVLMAGGSDTSDTHNDHFCVYAPAVEVRFMDGGGGTANTRCGGAAVVLNVQSIDCGICFLGPPGGT